MTAAIQTRERVGQALEILAEALPPFIARECQQVYGKDWLSQVTYGYQANQRPRQGTDGRTRWDIQPQLNILWERWNDVFSNVLGPSERNLVGELKGIRNRWAHQEPFSLDDAYRALDTIRLLLNAIAAGEYAAKIETERKAVLAEMSAAQAATSGTRQAMLIPLTGQPTASLRPWREIITPHPDVASGRYQVAEFVASLGDVVRGTATDEYRDPAAFFARTYLTEGLTALLTTALRRLAGQGADPVVELQTNFGGGKTHSLLALYHLFSGVPVSTLPGIAPLLHAAGVAEPPNARRAVLVGFEMSPGQPTTKPDGTVVHTLWGELAYQLLGQAGYALVERADREGVSPGAEVLRAIFAQAAPALVLIDEWVVYVRQLYGKSDLAGGSFDANMSFVQELTEAAKSSPRTLVVATIPASETEVGGDAGRAALARLANVFHRVESPWRPANTEEGFEIVRRRLFEAVADPKLLQQRDHVIKAFGEMYRAEPQEFPAECREADYRRRMAATYPIHPEVFDQLYQNWASLDKFQRTRGVLRLMAAVIHSLWQSGDTSLLILPAQVPLDDDVVENRFMDYLDDPWRSVLDKDIDGKHSLPLRLDQEHPNQGRYSASRRVARTIFFGSAPTLGAPADKRGITEAQMKLGAVQPGEQVSIFGDALRRLNDKATYLYAQGGRYWFSTQPSVNRLAADRAANLPEEEVLAEIETQLKREAAQRADFAKLHICPASPADVPDDREAKLVILRPQDPFVAREDGRPARQVAETYLDERSAGPRRYRNTLVFLAADNTRLAELRQAVREYLAWDSIVRDSETTVRDAVPLLLLDPYQKRQATDRRSDAADAVHKRIPETYSRLLVPIQETPTGPVTWREITLQGDGALAVRAAKKLRNEELLMPEFAGTRLRLELDRVPLWREGGERVSIKQLAEDFAQYLYLPRLKSEQLLLAAITTGVASLRWQEETFAYAESYDEARGRYLGLTGGRHAAPSLDGGGLLVLPAVALRQFAADEAKSAATAAHAASPETAASGTAAPVSAPGTGSTSGGIHEAATPTPPERAVLSRFRGEVTLDSVRALRDAEAVIKEVVQHLNGQLGAAVTLTLEINAQLPEGANEQLVRTVTENCRTLKFTSYGFDQD